MITLEEAFIKTSNDPSCSKIVKILDAGFFWQFCDDLLNKCLGRRSIAIDKASGHLWYIWPPDLTDEQMDALEHAKPVPIPKI